VSLDFLSTSPRGLARSPMERQALAAGARLEQRDGWNVAVRFDGEQAERERCAATAGFADLSHLGKLEVQAAPAELDALAGESLELGRASRVDGVWWCPYTSERALAVCEPADLPALREQLEEATAERDDLTSVIDVTTAFAALAIAGPLAREVFARFTALDLRDAVTPVRGFRPGSVARTPGAILREADARWLMLFGAALGQYMWTVVADAADSLGGGPMAADALPPIEEPVAADALQPAEGRIAGEASPRA
jgi:glycine cleavage system aminomethyltransferase T